jgi:hypothetical protein
MARTNWDFVSTLKFRPRRSREPERGVSLPVSYQKPRSFFLINEFLVLWHPMRATIAIEMKEHLILLTGKWFEIEEVKTHIARGHYKLEYPIWDLLRPKISRNTTNHGLQNNSHWVLIQLKFVVTHRDNKIKFLEAMEREEIHWLSISFTDCSLNTLPGRKQRPGSSMRTARESRRVPREREEGERERRLEMATRGRIATPVASGAPITD